jgi:hypothetical protein
LCAVRNKLHQEVLLDDNTRIGSGGANWVSKPCEFADMELR